MRPAWWIRGLLFAAVVAATAGTYALSVPKPIVVAVAWTLMSAAIGAWLAHRSDRDRPAPSPRTWSAILAPVDVYSESLHTIIDILQRKPLASAVGRNLDRPLSGAWVAHRKVGVSHTLQ